MAQPPKYTRVKNFADDFGHETDHSALNAELDKASNSINDIRANLAILQADDGRLRPDVVTYDSLDEQIVQDISAAVRTDVQGELDRAEAAADRAEAIADIIDIDAAEKIAGQVREDAEKTASASSQASQDAAAALQSAENAAASAAECAAIAAETLVRGICGGTGDTLVLLEDNVVLKDQQVLQIRVPATNETGSPTIRIGNSIYPLKSGNGETLIPGSIQQEQRMVFNAAGYFTLDAVAQPASESHAGLMRIATISEVLSGKDDSAVMTPKKLREAIAYGEEEMIPGETPLATGAIYLFYE